jgi:threonine/homoserine/homoserine lactone efflux protein
MSAARSTPPPGRDAALIAFVAVTAVDSAARMVVDPAPGVATTAVLAVVVFATLAWLARSGRTAPLWAVMIIMLINATGYLVTGGNALAAAASDPAAPLLRLAGGVVLTWGAFALFRGRNQRSDNG